MYDDEMSKIDEGTLERAKLCDEFLNGRAPDVIRMVMLCPKCNGSNYRRVGPWDDKRWQCRAEDKCRNVCGEQWDGADAKRVFIAEWILEPGEIPQVTKCDD